MLHLSDALIQVRGPIYGAGRRVVVDGRLTARRPFGCHNCQERCSRNPGSCVCIELPPAAQVLCKKQTVRLYLKAIGRKGWSGILYQRMFHNIYDHSKRHLTGRPRLVGWNNRIQRFRVDILRVSSRVSK